MRILRDHAPTTAQGDVEWEPRSEAKPSLCVHAGSEARIGQTTGSLASEIRGKDSVHWVTATAAPCISIFKPVLVDTRLSEQCRVATDRYDPDALWWRHERMHRAALRADFCRFLANIRQERDALEADFMVRVRAVLEGGNADERSAVIASCWNDAIATEERWFARLDRTARPQAGAYDLEWARLNRCAGLRD
jgi:secernin